MPVENLEFKTEINQLLNLMIHSLYSHKEIFLRELLSNASDAIDKARYEALVNSDALTDMGDWKIKITADKDAGTLTISDNGIGMTKEQIITELGTIAHSGTLDFMRALKEKGDINLIGQFGVGFYSSFMVADKVTVVTKSVKGEPAVKWESEAKGSFTVDDAQKQTRGTDVILHIKEDEKKYLEHWEISSIVKKYSDYIEYPIVMDVEREEDSALDKGTKVKLIKEETLNSQKAIWLKDKSEITPEQYNEFYKHVSRDFTDPLSVIHFKAEGTSEFTALIYIPSQVPMDIFYEQFKIGPVLYVKRVQIMDHCEELVPKYLRFVKGVVDSSDLPLNVSREILQNNPHVSVINKNITKKVLDTLADMKQNDIGKYRKFYLELGKVLKEGVHFDFQRRETIADLLLFRSTKTGKDSYTTLKEYVDTMREGQEEIFYITGASYEEAAQSPHLEKFNDKGYEVLFMLDEIDDIIFGYFEYKGKRLKSVIKGSFDLDKQDEKKKEEEGHKYEKLLSQIKNRLKDDVKEVRLSGRLKQSPCCLVSDEGAIDPAMERMLRSMGKDVPKNLRILEINPDHPLIETLSGVIEKDTSAADAVLDLLYEQALVLDGNKPKDPALFAKKLTELMLESLRRSA
ncbi:molecular chaperone HtpG [Candidatus Magnetominusculus xianensis]|uniref:Chaperone protein HtpG n=1 Tax=Candidatus Magnetominusculus xianensis TaxID=1748249 RepID=A0ABR5SJ13_9BACT|nr:molecular chaperone HtpG [Candidatus Magnetominusculus xianensis]KWT91765.1 molecular chaperone HtpG [Candidatus Magnetominusculus xianensis]MBF0404859.1 molecular chaperone HtpG [Nitrospirota bacterium]